MARKSTCWWRFVVPTILLSGALAAPAAAQSVSFVGRRDFSTGGMFVNAVAKADFNGDGIMDLATANSDSDDASVLLGNGDGTFQAGRTFAVGNSPGAVATGDFNGDGAEDLVVANRSATTISILLGVGDGTLQAAQHLAVGGSPTSIAVADFNEDGALDLVVANSATGDNSVSLLFGNGDGTFQPADNQNVGATPRSVIAADFNADGHMDFAVANEGACCWSAYDLAVRLGHGNGMFRGADRYPISEGPRSVAAGDLNGDGITDLVVAGAAMTILLGVGDGTFAPAAQPGPRFSGGFITIADLNADGMQDLALAGGLTEVLVALGNGDATFQPPLLFDAGRSPQSIAIDDFNRDGTLDMSVAGGGASFVALLLGMGDGTFSAERTMATGPESSGRGASSVAAGDLNADGILDLVVPTWLGTSVLLGGGDGTFQRAVTFLPSSAHHSSVVIDDFNGDGKPDLVIANAGFPFTQTGRTSLHFGNGDGTFQPASTIATGGAPYAAAAADFNHDGLIDVALANHSSFNLSVLLGNGDGTFQPVRTLATGHAPRAVAVSDLDGDGHQDLVAAIENSGNVALFSGNGDGTFQAAQTFAAGSFPVAVVVADFNGDGRPDVATAGGVARAQPGRATVLLGNGDGTLEPARTFVIGDTPWAMAAADFDGDGTTDLATVNVESNNVSVLINDGHGSFHPSVEFGAGSDAWALAAGDFDGDGRPDIVVVNHRSNGNKDLSILMNETAPPLEFHTLTAARDGNGTGLVTSTSTPESWGQIDCGDTCTATYVSGTTVTLTAQADTGSTFAGWSGCDDVSGNACTVAMSEARWVTATFVLERFTLSVSKGGLGSGTVTSTSDPPSATQINCGVTCAASYDWNTVVTLTATPAFGNLFIGWTGCDASSNATCRVTVNRARSVTATFVGVPIGVLGF